VPVHGFEDSELSDEPALSFTADDVQQLIDEAGLQAISERAVEEGAVHLKKAVSEFLMGWRRSARSPPGKWLPGPERLRNKRKLC
jgi:hypothetical protein